MIVCEICKTEFKNPLALTHHIKVHNIEIQKYFDMYLSDGKKGCLNCGKETKFKSLSVGYIKFCSIECTYKYRVGKKRKTNLKNIDKNVECKICNSKLISLKALSQHIFAQHPEVTPQAYYNKFLKIDLNKHKCLSCGKDTIFNSLSKGYQKYCGSKCANSNKDKIIKFKKSYLQNDISLINKKRKKTNLERYGNEIANRNEQVKEKNKIAFLQTHLDKKIEQVKYFDLQFADSNFKIKTIHDMQRFKCNKCNKIFEETLSNIMQRVYKCPCQLTYTTSINENKVKEFLQKELPTEEFIFNKKMNGYEFDILIPNKKIAIEYNGLYWHSERNLKDPINYHNKKLDICNENNYKLIHIFEDEWLFKNDIIMNRLLHILDSKKCNRIHARKCIIKEITTINKDEFLNKYHIQGKDFSSIKLGAFYQEQLVSVMTFSKGNIAKGSHSEEGVWELNRFCSDYNYHIPGIASKLLKHFQRNYEWKQIFSYADRRWSTGNLYYKLGFNLDHITKPNYWYVKTGMERIHRFALRKKPDEPKDIPEWVLRQKEGYYRIWDCGNFKFLLTNY